MFSSTLLSYSDFNPVHLYSVRLDDLKIFELMEEWLPEVQDREETNYMAADVCLDVTTSTKVQLFYLALISVVGECGGCLSKDRFVVNHKFLSLEELKTITISGELEKQHVLDTLFDLVNVAYKKISVVLKFRNSTMENNFQLFWFYRAVFNAALHLLKQYSREEFSGTVYTKSLLTILMKQKNPNTLINEVKKQLNC